MTATARLTYQDAQALIEAMDTGIFKVFSANTPGDRHALLALQNIVRRTEGSYVYIEIGSERGGTLLPHVLDPACRLAISIDMRPPNVPDERGVSFKYDVTSTATMLANIAEVAPPAAMLKILTHECDARHLPAEARGVPYHLAFIDGEHTNRAAFQDFISLWPFAAPDCIIAFHDANLVSDALANVEAFLTYSGVRFESLVLRDVVFALFIGKYAPLAAPLRHEALDKEAFLNHAKEDLWQQIARLRQPAA